VASGTRLRAVALWHAGATPLWLGQSLAFLDVPRNRKRRRRFALPAHSKGSATPHAGLPDAKRLNVRQSADETKGSGIDDYRPSLFPLPGDTVRDWGGLKQIKVKFIN
jgi:hypothetical protein